MTELPSDHNPAFWASTPSGRGEKVVLTVRHGKKSISVFRDSLGYLWAPRMPGSPVLDQEKIQAAVLARRRNFKI
jgi:hypothetical protein